MLDLASPKITTPAFLFAALSPGLLLQLPDKIPFLNKNALASGQTSIQAVMFHALVFIIMYKIIARMMGLVLTRADLIVPAILFILLSPGMLLQLPDTLKLRTGQTSLQSTLVHALVFALVFAFMRVKFPKYY
tara:strand:+ start:344 stop:742 length:399 start_codon:yes stop_codon:yes gene_type:complete